MHYENPPAKPKLRGLKRKEHAREELDFNRVSKLAVCLITALLTMNSDQKHYAPGRVCHFYPQNGNVFHALESLRRKVWILKNISSLSILDWAAVILPTALHNSSSITTDTG